MNRLTPGLIFTLICVANVGNISNVMSTVIPVAGFVSPVSLLIGCSIGLLLTLMALKLALRLPAHNFLADGSAITGKVIHRLAVFAFFIYFLSRAAFELRGLTFQVNAMYLPQTPHIAIAALFCTVTAIAVRYGILTIAYIGQYFALMVFPTFFIIIGLSATMPLKTDMLIAFITHMNAQQLPKAIAGGIFCAPWFGESIFILFLAPLFAKEKRMKHALIAAFAFFAVQSLSHLITILLSFGPLVAGNMVFPIAEQLRYIRVSDFLENLDPFLLVLLFPIVTIKISLYVYLATLTLGQLMAMKDLRPLSLTVTALTCALSFHIVSRLSELPLFTRMFWTWYAWLIQCIPLLYLLIATLRARIAGKKHTPEPAAPAADS
ncbi:spore germination protein KB [Paenibacillus phyllosphaerae]|uniref:Spore germination protein KB n=1 Tax=Paenibacillus phyllosphaerae TaxID=274593 RepID=A0A7W5FPN1_9BACL|nr:GerAB/ArcD/ProY family transporter [Paenibacillus phyllosphaerae]MBB3112540.1 spore germination protein KB [Paenibacillus phyllosphaerae]